MSTLKALRSEANLTQDEVKDHLGTNRIRIYIWENKKAIPSLENQIKLAVFYRTPLVKLQEGMNWPLTPHIQIMSGGGK